MYDTSIAESDGVIFSNVIRDIITLSFRCRRHQGLNQSVTSIMIIDGRHRPDYGPDQHCHDVTNSLPLPLV